MLCVHLAPRSSIDGIIRNGLRLGRGRRGRGVYGIPLFALPRYAARQLEVEAVDESDPSTKHQPATRLVVLPPLTSLPSQPSTDTWKWLFKRKRERGRASYRRQRPVAIVFEPPAAHWPADMYFEIPWETAERVLGPRTPPDDGYVIEQVEQMPFARYFPWLAGYDPCTKFWVRALDSEGAGRLLHRMLAADLSAFDRYDESVEIVFRSRIPPRAIRSIIPLDRPTRDYRQRRERAERANAWAQ